MNPNFLCAMLSWYGRSASRVQTLLMTNEDLTLQVLCSMKCLTSYRVTTDKLLSPGIIGDCVVSVVNVNYQHLILFIAEKWKLVRQITTPGFSNSKIKLMNLPMRLTAEDFVADIKDEIRAGKGRCEKFAVDKAIHTMLTDLVSRCIFSIDINNRNNKNNRFVQLVAELFSPAGNPVSHQLVLWSCKFH